MNDKLGNTDSVKEVEYEVKELFNNAKNVFLIRPLRCGYIITDDALVVQRWGCGSETCLFMLILPKSTLGETTYLIKTDRSIYKLSVLSEYRGSGICLW